MKKQEALTYLNNINKVIQGSQKILDAIDAGKDINTSRAIKACTLSNLILAEQMKSLIIAFTDDNKRRESTDFPFKEIFGDFVK